MNTKSPLLLGSLGLSIVTVGVLLTMHYTDEPVPFENVHFSAPVEPTEESDEILGAEYIRYTSSTFGYEVRVPGTWEVDDSRLGTRTDVLSAPDNDVVIRIGADALPQGTDMSQLETVVAQMEENVRADASLNVENMDRGTWKGYPALMVKGSRTTDSGDWQVQSYTAFRLEKSDALTVMVTTRGEKIEQLKSEIQNIVESLSAK